MKTLLNSWFFVIIMCFTLGFAPYTPEPHLFGKIRWIVGGAVGMQAVDWFDTILHSIPFLLLIRLIWVSFKPK